MKHLLLATLTVLLAVSISSSSFAQTHVITTSELVTSGKSVSPVWLTQPATQSASIGEARFDRVIQGKKMQPLDESNAISYFDLSAPVHPWQCPFQFTAGSSNAAFFRTAERISMGSSAFIDSVKITFDAISGDSIFVYLLPDKIQSYPAGEFHIMDLQSAVISRTAVPIGTTVSQQVVLTIKYPHLAVDQDFHVAVLPRAVLNGTQLTFTSQFTIEGDSEATRARTTANCHSNFSYLDLNALQEVPYVIDSFFQFGGGKPLYSNFNIQAYVTAPPEVASIEVAPATELDFGTVGVNTTGTTSAWLKNVSNNSVAVDFITAPAQSIFKVKTDDPFFEIAPGDSAKLTLTFTPKATGTKNSSFNVVFSDNTMIPFTLQGTASAAGVGTPSSKPSVGVYPNPATTSIRSMSNESMKVELIDALGRTALRGTMSSGKSLDVSELPQGHYIALLRTADGIQSLPLVVSH